MKKVSILIPLYNSEKFIKETIECCLKQTYPNIEIIIVDDGSTDNSYAIAKSYESEHIHIFRQPNSGACKARNLAFEKSTGDYIMYLDADDLMSYNKIEKQIELLSQYDYHPNIIATCRYEEFYENSNVKFNKRIIYRNYSTGLDLLEDAWNNSVFFLVSCYLVSRKLIEQTGKWNEQLTKVQDGEFFCRVLSQASHILFCKEAYFLYRRGHSSISTSNRFSPQKLQSSLDARIICEKTILPLRSTPKMKHALAHIYSEIMLNSPVNSIYYNEAKQHIINLGEKPFHPSPAKTVRILEKILGFENLLFLKSKIQNKKSK